MVQGRPWVCCGRLPAEPTGPGPDWQPPAAPAQHASAAAVPTASVPARKVSRGRSSSSTRSDQPCHTGSTDTAASSGSRRWGLFGVTPRSRSRSRSAVNSEHSEKQVNGFEVKEELDAIRVQAENVAPFSLPQEVLTYRPCAEATIAQFKNGEAERKIHCNVELTQEEQRKLVAMRDYAKSQGKPVSPSLAIAASRYLSRAKGDPRKAVREMGATQDWRGEYFKDGPVIDKNLEDDFAHGVMYFVGRDAWLRPALVIRASRMPAAWMNDKRLGAERLMRMLVFCMEYMIRYMLLPGRVEGGVVLMDLGGLSVSQVPFGSLKQFLTTMANHYVNRIFKFYLLNLPLALNSVMSFGMRMLTERQRQKVALVRGMEELRRQFALHQLESDFGGSRPTITKFFPFPLLAGPFEAGCSLGPCDNAIADVHRAFAPSALLGRVWDPSETREANLRMKYTEAAADIFARCGQAAPRGELPLPPTETQEMSFFGPPMLLGSSASTHAAGQNDDKVDKLDSNAALQAPAPHELAPAKLAPPTKPAAILPNSESAALEFLQPPDEGHKILIEGEVQGYFCTAHPWFPWLPSCSIQAGKS